MTGRLGRLSARRRRFAAGLAGLAAAALLAVLAAVIAVIATRAGGGGAAAARAAGYPAQDRPGPVLLVPGYGGNTSALVVLAARLRAAGRRAIVVALPGSGTGSLVFDARALDRAVSRELAAGAPSVDVIGYSAGGVAALLWARADDGARKARRVITLGSPFHGTSVAAAAAGLVPGACPAACRQLVPGSGLLTGLAAGVPRRLPWLSLWSADDTTVVPPDSARLAGALSLSVQAVCPGQRIGHSQLPTSPVVTAIVLRAIGPGPLRRPGSGCRR